MIAYSDEFDAYVIEFEDAMICWDDEPADDCEQTAAEVRRTYFENLRHIAETIYEELKEMFSLADIDEVISKLGRPLINPDNGQVTYCENSFDDSHIISFEYLDDAFQDIQYVSADG